MRIALATSREGSAMWRAPRSCTHTSASGQSLHSAPVAPAWSKWMCVSRIARGTKPSSPSSSARCADSGPGSTITSSIAKQQIARGTPWCMTSISRTGDHDVLEGDGLVTTRPRATVLRDELEPVGAQRLEQPLVVVGDRLLGQRLVEDRDALVDVEERKARAAGLDQRAGRVVEQEERREQPAAGREHARALGQVLRRIGLEQVREDAGRDDEVEACVVVGEPVRIGALGAPRVVAGVEQVGDLEAEVRMAPVAPPAPGDAVAVDVEPVVAAVRGEVAGQRARHPADAAADVEHALAGLQAAELDEVRQELVAGRGEVAVADEVQPPRRREAVAAP